MTGMRQRFDNVVIATTLLAAALLWAGLRLAGIEAPASWCAAIAVLCIAWWILEPVPIPVTSLLPLALLPLTGVLTPTQVAESYGSPLILLLLGGFLLSTAMESSGAHRRLAVYLVGLTGGGSARRVVLGFMLASALLSMWISNTATTLMLFPVALAVLERSDDRRFGVPLLLGVAYAASIGGTGTPIGTPPNLIFMQVYADTTGTQIGFIDWMAWALPCVALFLPLAWAWLTRHLGAMEAPVMARPGRWTSRERRVLTVFALTALAWVTRSGPFGGWSGWLDLPGANDAAVALVAVVVMFALPAGDGQRLLDWNTAARLPWGVLLLFSGGVCLARGFAESGLSGHLAGFMSGLQDLPPLVIIAVIALTVTFLTEATSNTATTALLMPLLAAAAVGAGLDPALLMVPAALSASCAFMLPVATGPNSIVFGSGLISARVMAREGLALNFIGAAVITAVCYLRL
jgi:sodium-dependent dicarboxylate transporter 2/3/5